MRRAGLVAAVVMVLVGGSMRVRAADGVQISERTVAGARTTENQVQIEKTRMRAEIAGGSSTQTVIFDGGKQVLWVLMNERKSYMEMTKADIDRLAGQMSGAMAQMQETLKNLPPAQRAQIEAMMKGRGMAAIPSAATEYRRAGTDKVGRWTCAKYEGYQAGQKVSEVCTVAPSVLGFTAADFDVSRQLAEFFGKIMPQQSDNLFRIGDGGAGNFEGIPVRRSMTVGGQAIVSEITAVSRQTFPESNFSLPDGYTRQNLLVPGAVP